MSLVGVQPQGPIRAVVADLCGTLLDFGALAPAAALRDLFQQYEITVTEAEVREPMGMKRREHIKTMLSMPSVWEKWEAKHGAAPGELDVLRLYEAFMPLQMELLRQNSVLVPGALEAAAKLQRDGVAISVTTGCNEDTMNVVLDRAREQGFIPDCAVSSAQVNNGRPAPWMIFRSMELLDVFPGVSVVNIGDTFSDVLAGRNAGVWSIAVVATGNMMALSQGEFERLGAAERNARLKSVRKAMADAGAHFVIDSIAQLPPLLDTLKMRIEDGARP